MQYPDTILVTKESTFTQGLTGNFQAGAAGATFTSECRGEVAGQNAVIVGIDGNEVKYSWIVYMPRTTEQFEFGSLVTFTKADGGVYSGTVKLFSNGQLNSRLWV